jgi:hypothetical protein
MHCGVLGRERSISQYEDTLDHLVTFFAMHVISSGWACVYFVRRRRQASARHLFVLFKISFIVRATFAAFDRPLHEQSFTRLKNGMVRYA